MESVILNGIICLVYLVGLGIVITKLNRLYVLIQDLMEDDEWYGLIDDEPEKWEV